MLKTNGMLTEIGNDHARIGILPNLGASLAYYDVKLGGKWIPLLRPMQLASTSPTDLDVMQSALILQAPWTNRFSTGGIERDGVKFSATSAQHPLYGNALKLAWLINEETSDTVDLILESHGPAPFDYAARVQYRLFDADLTIELAVTHRGSHPVRYGAGFHMWLPRTPKTRLTAPAHTVWLDRAERLPAVSIPLTDRPAWNFTRPQTLPNTPINTCFGGWPGIARIDWPDRRLGLNLSASDNLGFFQLSSAGAEATTFCFDPVSHVIDAHQQPEDRSLQHLSEGKTITIGLHFHPGLLPAAS